ncbi:MAG: TRAP transporter small permease [Clostridia bacterium]|nr:TRAP transporter small permease [Clostridia bacterium]
MKKIWKELEENICVVCMIGMLVVLTLQVVLRYIFKNSNAWSDEVARYLFIWVIFIGAAYAAKKGTHIRIESLNNIFPKKIRKHVTLIGNIVWLVFNITLFYFSARYTINLFESNQMSQGLNIRMAYAYAAIPIGFFLLIIRIIQRQFFHYEKTE